MKLYISIIIAMFVVMISTEVAHAQTREFNILDYNTALGQYEAGQYALAYNTLLSANAPREAFVALFPEI